MNIQVFPIRQNVARILLLYFVFFVCFVVSLRGQEPLRTAGDRPVDIQNLRLDLKVDLPQKTIDAVATMDLKSLRTLSSFTLDAAEFEVKEVAVDNGNKPVPVKFSHDGQKLVLDLEPAWPAGHEARLRIAYRIHEPRDGLFFFGPSPAEPDVPLTVWSQGEPVSNRFWIPCLDHPNERQTTELVVNVADGFRSEERRGGK